MKQEQKQAPTFESVWALLQENAQLMKESRADLKESRADFDRRMAESSARFESEQQKSRADFEQRMAKSSTRFERDLKKSRADFDLRMKKLVDQVSGMSKSNGDFAEDYFFNAFEQGQQNFFGEKFDRMIRGKGKRVEDEYDIVMINGKTAGIIEVKYKARREDIPQALKKVTTFRVNFPEYQSHKIYVALAALTINATLEQECVKRGIAVIKQVGDKVIIYDKHLKAF